MDPNSAHQMWSRWTFLVCSAKSMELKEVLDNAMRWLRQGFGTVGRVRVKEHVWSWRIECEVEGVPAHDPEYVQSVKRAFRDFVQKGWGSLAIPHVKVEVLAGDKQDGKPRDQLVVMPSPIESGISLWR